MTDGKLIAPDACRECGVQCGFVLAEPVDGSTQPWCKEHCPDHDYVFCRFSRTHECKRCGGLPPHDFFVWDDGGLHFK